MNNRTYTVFTYGTLMKGFSGYEKYLTTSRFLGNATIKGKMYHTNSGYPVVTQSKRGRVISGELYEVDKNTLLKLRNYEGIYSFFTYYKEEILPVLCENGEKVYARVFVAHNLAKPIIKLTAKPVKRGDWRQYISCPQKNYRKWILTALLILINCIFLLDIVMHS